MLINVVITLEFVKPVSRSVDELFDGAVDLLIDTFTGVLTVVVICGLSGIVVGAFMDANVNVFAGLMTEVKFIMSTPLEGFRC